MLKRGIPTSHVLPLGGSSEKWSIEISHNSFMNISLIHLYKKDKQNLHCPVLNINQRVVAPVTI